MRDRVIFDQQLEIPKQRGCSSAAGCRMIPNEQNEVSVGIAVEGRGERLNNKRGRAVGS